MITSVSSNALCQSSPNLPNMSIVNVLNQKVLDSNFDADNEFLEPLFSDMPSVSHEYNTRAKDFCVIDIDINYDIDNSVDVASSYCCNHSMETVICFNIFEICEFCTAPTVSPLPDDTTAFSKTDYTSLYNFLSLFIQSAKFMTVRSHVETDRWGKHGIWYEDLYNFSGWKHFTTGRSKTRIF